MTRREPRRKRPLMTRYVSFLFFFASHSSISPRMPPKRAQVVTKRTTTSDRLPFKCPYTIYNRLVSVVPNVLFPYSSLLFLPPVSPKYLVDRRESSNNPSSHSLQVFSYPQPVPPIPKFYSYMPPSTPKLGVSLSVYSVFLSLSSSLCLSVSR